ncbi:uncharacterized protein PSFLO_06868 [Pseudozyma flocculosa]|uniref:Secreted protein n=1 Tax=Pseudozyma flocculosa TaxID=84751 RepID=A0A5C3FB84_9BASI|nr:uncharacterized protein PSFLO_06868 [Pseudozyma flocculosa]
MLRPLSQCPAFALVLAINLPTRSASPSLAAPCHLALPPLLPTCLALPTRLRPVFGPIRHLSERRLRRAAPALLILAWYRYECRTNYRLRRSILLALPFPTLRARRVQQMHLCVPTARTGRSTPSARRPGHEMMTACA